MFFCKCSKKLIDSGIIELKGYKFFIDDIEVFYCPVCGRKLPVILKCERKDKSYGSYSNKGMDVPDVLFTNLSEE
jgi:hypothetical protein